MKKPRTLVRQDDKGIFVVAGGYVARPGPVRGYDHAYDMSDGEIKPGDHVFAYHMAGTPITKITTVAGKILYWHHEDR